MVWQRDLILLILIAAAIHGTATIAHYITSTWMHDAGSIEKWHIGLMLLALLYVGWRNAK